MDKDIRADLLARLMNERTPVAVIHTNGYQTTGLIKDFDSKVVVVEVEGRPDSIINLSAVSTIQPRPRPNH